MVKLGIVLACNLIFFMIAMEQEQNLLSNRVPSLQKLSATALAPLASQNIVLFQKQLNRACLEMLNYELIIGNLDRLTEYLKSYSGSHISQLMAYHGDIILAAGYDKDNLIIIIENNNNLLLYKLSEKSQSDLEGHSDSIKTYAIGGYGRYFSGGNDHCIRCWQLNGEAFTSLSFDVKDIIYSMTVSPCKKYLAVGVSKTIQLWDIHDSNFTCVNSELHKYHADVVTAVVFTPCGKYIISGSADGRIFLWNNSKKEAQLLFYQEGTIIQSLQISGDGRYLLVLLSDSNSIIEGQVELLAIQQFDTIKVEPILLPIELNIHSTAFICEGKYLIALSQDMTLWNIQNKNHIYPTALDIFPDGAELLTCTPCGTYVLFLHEHSIKLLNLHALINTLYQENAFIKYVEKKAVMQSLPVREDVKNSEKKKCPCLIF